LGTVSFGADAADDKESEAAKRRVECSCIRIALTGIAKANTASIIATNKLFTPIRSINILKINLQK
jgi:hypothetical protein